MILISIELLQRVVLEATSWGIKLSI